MAIATFDRDAARSGAGAEPRFKLVEELFRTGDAVFWRADDRRSHRRVTVRVIEVGREDGARRLGDLHRERTLADRLGHPEVLRMDVPLIEGERIYQLVDPEPVNSMESMGELGRLSLLTLLVGAARVLAEAHARGVFHGALARSSCLRTADGRLILQGFTGDAPAAALVRDGMAADHHAFLVLAEELLQPSGGPPPRLRRYFQRELAPGAARPPSNALASLADELRESLEDTFPWPADPPSVGTASKPAAAKPADDKSAAAKPRSAVVAPAPGVTAAASPTPPSRSGSAPKLVAAAVTPVAQGSQRALQVVNVASPAPVPTPAPSLAVVSATVAPPAVPVPIAPSKPASAVQGVAPPPATPAAARASTEIWYPPVSPPAPAPARTEEPRATGSLRPWIALALLIAALVAVWQFGGKHQSAVGTSRGAASPTAVDPAASPAPAAIASPTPPSGESSPPPVQASAAASGSTPAVGAPAVPAVATARSEAAGAADAASLAGKPSVAPPVGAAPGPVRTPASRAAENERRGGAAAVGVAEDAQIRRSRVATLVAGGTRALNALEPAAAAEAFAAALAIAPDDVAARDGSQRARRLAGVAALMQDARDASQRGDHARAVQGYSQALSNDPRNRGLAEALASARRNLASDPAGTLLAEGHAALGGGRLEAAQAAFERALQINPRAPGARAGILQATTAIALRDAAATRRPSSNASAP